MFLNRKLIWAHSLTLVFLYLFWGCSTKPVLHSEKPAADTAAAIESGARFTAVFCSESGFSAANTINETADVIFECTPEISSVSAVPSPGRDKVALSFYDTKKKETNLIVYTISSKKTYWAKRNKNRFSVNVFWESDSVLYTNFYELKISSKNRPPVPSSPYTECIDVARDKVLKSFRPKNGAVLEAYLQQKYLVYSDNSGFYLTEKGSNKLLKSIRDFSLINRKGVQFSPDGKNLLYIESKSSRNDGANELILADYDGTDDKIILSSDYDPRDIVWSPDGSIIASTIRSAEFPGARHLALFDVKTRKTSFNSEESYGKVPSFYDLAFNPSGTFLFTRVAKPNNGDTLRYFAVRNMATGREYKAGDTTGLLKPATIGKFYGWMDDQTVMFMNDEFGLTVYNLIESKARHIDLNNVLFIKQIY